MWVFVVSLLSVLSTLGTYSRSLNTLFPWSCDDPGSGHAQSQEASSGLRLLPKICFSVSPRRAHPQLRSSLCFSCSCRNSSSPRPTRPQAPIPRRKGPPGARQASGPRVSGLVLRYFCPQISRGPQVGFEGYNLQLYIRGCQVQSTWGFPPCASQSPCSWCAGHFPVWGSGKSPGLSHTPQCFRHRVIHWVRAGTGKVWPAFSGLILTGDTQKHEILAGCGDHKKVFAFLLGEAL